MENHFEHQHHVKHLDDSFLNVGGGQRMGGGMAAPRTGMSIAPPLSMPHGGTSIAKQMPSPPSTPSSPAQKEGRYEGGESRHQEYVERNLAPMVNYYPSYSSRQFKMTPKGRHYFRGRRGNLYGYPYSFWYPFFYAIYDGNYYDELYLKQHYDLTDDEWNSLVDRLYRNGYLIIG